MYDRSARQENFSKEGTVAAGCDVDLGKRLGVAPTVVAAAAAQLLCEGSGWFWEGTGGHRKKTYTAAGLACLESAILGKKAADGADPPPPAPAANVDDAAPIQLIVYRLHPNPTWVAVKTPAGVLQDVRVRNSIGLAVGRALLCRSVNGQWVCADPRRALAV